MDSKLYKYPRTFHVPWSPGLKNDDRKHPNMEFFEGKEIVVTEKMDGENTTMYMNGFHARSVDSAFANHPSRDYVKGIWGQIKHLIPKNVRICGENLYAIHSIKYTNLEDYFLVFSIWKFKECYSWNDTLEKCTLLGLKTPRTLYRGIYDEEIIKSINIDNQNMEGYVIRIVDSFYHDFDEQSFFIPLAKYVRKKHVQTDEHWMKNWNKTKINGLKM